MQKPKGKRAVYLALSGMCAVLSTTWYWFTNYFWDTIKWIIIHNIIEIVLYFFFIPLAVFAVLFSIKGIVPAKYAALKSSIVACIAILIAYIAIVAFVKVDFVNVWPIRIACGLAPLLMAFLVMLFYGGEKWRRVFCSVLATLALLASTLTFTAGSSSNARDSIGYSESPGGTHKIVVVRDLTTKWKVSVACPVYGLWYKQKDPVYVNPDALENEDIVWIDEHTAQINSEHGFQRTITFK